MDLPYAFSAHTGTQGPAILLVDNEPGMLEVCAEALERGLPGGMRLEAVSHPGQALGLLRERGPFDLLITNLQMPGMSGLTLMQEARALVPDLPVMIVTGYPRAETAERARALGAVDYLSKPFDLEGFVERVRGALGVGGAATGEADGL
jgi:CheY-like chemotaxis protein